MNAKRFSATMDGCTHAGLTDLDVIGCNEYDAEFIAWVATAEVLDEYDLGEGCPMFIRTA